LPGAAHRIDGSWQQSVPRVVPDQGFSPSSCRNRFRTTVTLASRLSSAGLVDDVETCFSSDPPGCFEQRGGRADGQTAVHFLDVDRVELDETTLLIADGGEEQLAPVPAPAG
jgi:hypothetical protein